MNFLNNDLKVSHRQKTFYNAIAPKRTEVIHLSDDTRRMHKKLYYLNTKLFHCSTLCINYS